jgi:hypothetical protein
MEPRRDALIEIAGRRVERAAEGAGVRIQGVAVESRHQTSDVDDVDARARGELEYELDRR